jgi:hypothetical protein
VVVVVVVVVVVGEATHALADKSAPAPVSLLFSTQSLSQSAPFFPENKKHHHTIQAT